MYNITHDQNNYSFFLSPLFRIMVIFVMKQTWAVVRVIIMNYSHDYYCEIIITVTDQSNGQNATGPNQQPNETGEY